MIDVMTMQELWNKDTDGYLPILLEIYNPDIAWSEEEKEVYGQENCYLRVIADENKVKYKGYTWLPCAFDYTPPESDGKKIGVASISISALDSRVRKLLRTIRLPSKAKVVAMFAKQTKEDNGHFIYKFKELNTMSFDMNNATSDKAKATFNLVFSNVLSQNVPYDIATQDRTPSA